MGKRIWKKAHCDEIRRLYRIPGHDSGKIWKKLNENSEWKQYFSANLIDLTKFKKKMTNLGLSHCGMTQPLATPIFPDSSSTTQIYNPFAVNPLSSTSNQTTSESTKRPRVKMSEPMIIPGAQNPIYFSKDNLNDIYIVVLEKSVRSTVRYSFEETDQATKMNIYFESAPLSKQEVEEILSVVYKNLEESRLHDDEEVMKIPTEKFLKMHEKFQEPKHQETVTSILFPKGDIMTHNELSVIHVGSLVVIVVKQVTEKMKKRRTGVISQINKEAENESKSVFSPSNVTSVPVSAIGVNQQYLQNAILQAQYQDQQRRLLQQQLIAQQLQQQTRLNPVMPHGNPPTLPPISTLTNVGNMVAPPPPLMTNLGQSAPLNPNPNPNMQ